MSGHKNKYGRAHWLFAAPALALIVLLILLPWAFTAWMSLHEWKPGGDFVFVGPANFLRAAHDSRLLAAFIRTLVYAGLAVFFPMLFGLLAALAFHQSFPMRGFLRGVFMMPMMATPVAIALIWTMVFQPQIGVLNYLLSLIGLPPQFWLSNPGAVIPALVLVETWQWTPLVMLIVLGGLSAIPRAPYECAALDGAGPLRRFWSITLPFVAPFLMLALILRLIDALKSFDIIFAMTQGGPGDASETLNLYLYQTAFAYGDIGYASAIAIGFFVVITALSLITLHFRAKKTWSGYDRGSV